MRTRIYGKHGPTVIVLHGGPAALGEAAPVARGLSSKFVAVEALQRGSDQQPLTVSRHVEDLYQFIAGLKNDPRPSLVGESWGAMLALAYASAHPENIAAVVLVGCGTFDQPSRAKMNEIIESRMDEQLRNRLRLLSQEYPDQDDRLHAERRLMEKVYSYDPIAEDEQMELVEPFDSRAHTETWNDMLRMQENGTYPAAFSRITSPVLMLHGDYDPHPGQMIYESLREYVPQIEYRELRNCGHSPWKERHARKVCKKGVLHADDQLASCKHRQALRRNLTNRWSSRLEYRLAPRGSSRREPRLLGGVGGAAQLYVRRK